MLEELVTQLYMFADMKKFPKVIYITKKDYNALVEEMECNTNFDRIYTFQIILKPKGNISFSF